MKITIEAISPENINDAGQCDGEFVIDARLVLHMENNQIRYTITDMPRTKKRYDNDDTDYTNNLEESQLGLDPTADEKGLALTYTYDDLGRLTAVSGNATTASYTLDEEGNITLAD